MKKILQFSILLLFLFTSCAAPFQVFDTASSNVERYENDVYAFENEDVAISYDFWANGGVVLFNITNKTDASIFIDFNQSKFVVNQESIGYAPNIPKLFDRELVNKKEFIKEINPQSNLNIEGFPINERLTRGLKKDESRDYNSSSSPFQFENILVYAFDETIEDSRKIQNTFWVTSVEGMRRSDFQNVDKYDANKAGKFYVSQSENIDNSPTVFWVQLGIELLQILFLF